MRMRTTKQEREPDYWVVGDALDDDMALADVYEPLAGVLFRLLLSLSLFVCFLHTYIGCLTRAVTASGKQASLDTLYAFVVESWNPKPLRDGREPSEAELRHSIGMTLTTDPAFRDCGAGPAWATARQEAAAAAAASGELETVVVRNNSGRVSRAAAIAAAGAIVSGVAALAPDIQPHVPSPRAGRGRRRVVGASAAVVGNAATGGNATAATPLSGRKTSGRGKQPPQPGPGFVCMCGATRPADSGRAKWKWLDANGEFLCHSCYASRDTVCAVCKQQYVEDEGNPWICCERCAFVHLSVAASHLSQVNDGAMRAATM